MDCKKLREIMDLHIDDELSPEGSLEVQSHLADCPPCRKAMDRIVQLRELVRDEVYRHVPPAGLEDQIRLRISPEWPRYVAVPRVAVGLAALLLVLLLIPAVRGKAAAALDFVAMQLDDTRQVVLEGTVLCRDQQLQRKYGTAAQCKLTGHRGWLVTSDGKYWSILEGTNSRELLHDASMLGKRVIVRGRIFRHASSIEVENYELI